MSEGDGRDGYMRLIRDRGNALQERADRMRKATPDRVNVEVLAYVNGDVVTMQCGVYRLVYGMVRLPGGIEATYLPLRSHPIPGISPTEQGIMAAAVDAYTNRRVQ